ncbi:sulfotransferase family 2 domain-containing protein [Bizionia sp.]|uniref:sulfotransferase family 2 domain-containing protein n=1 Tax=Bizionia sp. TaxID=1954480 RepID=UPI003A94DC4A
MFNIKHSSSSFLNLDKNPAFNLARSHAISLYNRNAIYSFIPKNGCSTLRLSAAIDNGFIKDITQGHWIHSNNQTFNPSIKDIVSAEYSFVVLRCPFRRLSSVFLDKLVSKELDAWQYHSALDRRFNLDDLTFREFVNSLKNSRILRSNIHWRPQVDFLLYENYSDYFSMEEFSNAIDVLNKKIGFSVVDARGLTNHGITDFEMLTSDCFSNVSAFDIAVLKRHGKCPSHTAMYDEELMSIVTDLYRADFDIYVEKFGPNNLLFSLD